MFVEYFYEKPKLNGYRFHPKKGFKHGVELSLWEGHEGSEMLLDRFIFPFVAWLVETYGYDPKRYEPLFSDEDDMVRVYFRDEEDLTAFKLIWGEHPTDWDEDNECFKKEGIRVDSVLRL